MISVKMGFQAVATNVNHRLTQAFRKASFPISAGIVIGEISDQKTATAYLIFDDSIDVPGFLRHRLKIISCLLNGRLQTFRIDPI